MRLWEYARVRLMGSCFNSFSSDLTSEIGISYCSGRSGAVAELTKKKAAHGNRIGAASLAGWRDSDSQSAVSNANRSLVCLAWLLVLERPRVLLKKVLDRSPQRRVWPEHCECELLARERVHRSVLPQVFLQVPALVAGKQTHTQVPKKSAQPTSLHSLILIASTSDARDAVRSRDRVDHDLHAHGTHKVVGDLARVQVPLVLQRETLHVRHERIETLLLVVLRC